MAANQGGNVWGNTVSIGASAAVIVGRSTSGAGDSSTPRSVAIKNNHATNILYIGSNGDSAALTTGNGFPLGPGESFTVDIMFFEEIWGIASGASTDVRVLVLNY